MTILNDLQSLSPTGIVQLFILDCTSLGGPLLRFHNGTNELTQPVVWDGDTYTPYPISISGISYTIKGTQPRPTIRFANVTAYFSGLAINYNDILNAKLTRIRTMVKYLDAVNFSSGNADADPTQYLVNDIYYLNRKSNEDKVWVDYELAAQTDVAGVQLPFRQIINNVCPWAYRGSECSYAGTNYFLSNDTPTTNAALDVCGKRLSSCKARFGTNAQLPYGGFPASGLQ